MAGLPNRFTRISSKAGLNIPMPTVNRAETREYPTRAEDYELIEECGQGVSGKVWRSLCKPFNSFVAVKMLDLESMNANLDEIIREAQIMKLIQHENILSLHCSFVHQEHLWMVMPYVKGGSVLNIMKYAYPQGLDEPVIATIMKSVLIALDYVHKQGAIHRDVKAGNILLGHHGEVKLADFGVASTMERSGDKLHTFVGTPCWMAPEVMEQTEGYDSKADIWSFGITMLELAHGMAPFAKYPPMKVLMMTLQQPAPQLQSTGEKQFSKEMQQLVAQCLVKDPTKRPTAARLLENRFFKNAADSNYLAKHLLADLPPLTERVKQMKVNKTGPGGILEKRQAMEKSQEEYVKGVSSWNFDVADLKAQASLEPDTDDGWNFDPPAANSEGQQAPAELPTTPGPDGRAKPETKPQALSLNIEQDANAAANMSPTGNQLSPTKPGDSTPANKVATGERKGRFQIVQADSALTADDPPALLELQSVALLDQDPKPGKAGEAKDIPGAGLPPPGPDPKPGKAGEAKDIPGAGLPPPGPLQRMSSGVNQDGEIPKKKASRFNIVSSSDDAGLPLKSAQPNIQRTASTAGLAATGEQTPPPIKGRLEAVLPHLEAMLKVHQKQGEELHNIVSAMTQASLGKPEALQRLAVNPPSALLDRMLPAESNQGTASRRELDRLASRVKELEDENKRLQAEYDKLHEKLERSKALLAD